MERQSEIQIACRRSVNCAVVVALMLLSGCMVGHDYLRPGATIKPAFSMNDRPVVQGAAANLHQWWSHFNDPVLHQLICETSTANLTLREAGQRIIESRARRDVAVGGLFPQSQTLDGRYSKSQISRNDANFFEAPGVFAPNIRPENWQIGLNASWELDFWGRYRRAIEAADANLEASIAAHDETRVLLLAEVGQAYVDLRTLEARTILARETLTIQRYILKIAQDKQTAGLGSAIDTAQAEVIMRQTESTLPKLEIARRQASHRLCTLMGQNPTDLTERIGWQGFVPTPPANLAFGIPADLLRQRPDVRRAERILAAQSARIGMAEAEFFPHVSLVGRLGYSAENPSSLFTPGSQVGLISPGFSWNILNYGRITNNVKAEEAVFEQLRLAYQSAVLDAAREAEDAMVAYVLGFEQAESLDRSAKASIVTVDKSLELYQAGAIDFGRVYVLQSESLRQRDNLAIAESAIALSLIDLFKSLGGGWQVSRVSNALPANIPPSAPPAVEHHELN